MIFSGQMNTKFEVTYEMAEEFLYNYESMDGNDNVRDLQATLQSFVDKTSIRAEAK